MHSKLSDVSRCWLILGITALCGAGGVAGWYIVHSQAVAADAAHIVGDGLPFVGTLILALDLRHEEQEGMVNAAIKLFNLFFLFFMGCYLVITGAIHYVHPEPVGAWMVAFSLGELVGNGGQAFLAHTVRDVYNDKSVHHSQMLHLWGDMVVSAGVVVVALIIAKTGWYTLDALASIAIGCILFVLAYKVLRSNEGAHGHAHSHHVHPH